MRVYGTSPLYNYAELIFRSKRLFIVSIILSTIAVSTLAAMRAGTYTATAVVLLSGTPQTGLQSPDDSQLGSIKYKLNVLNVVLKDPTFVKDAMRAGGLNKSDKSGLPMSEQDFDKFCRDVRGALSTTAEGNVLEITCRWPGSQADQIITAFYKAYSRNVLDHEDVLNFRQTQLLRRLLDEYTLKEKQVEHRVIAYKQSHAGQTQADAEQFNVAYENQVQRLKEQQNQIEMEQAQLAEVKKDLARTPGTIEDRTEYSYMQSPEYLSAVKNKEEIEKELIDLQKRYQDAHPQVVHMKELLADATKTVTSMQKSGKDQFRKGARTAVREAPNPDYQRLKSELIERQIRLEGMQRELANLEASVTSYLDRARSAPSHAYEYKWMTKDKDLYVAIRENLQARLETAIMDEKRDRELHLAEMTLMVPPQSELELTGVRNMIFYAVGPFLGLLIAFGFSLLAESLDHSLRTPVEVEKYLGKPVLAVLPRMDGPRAAGRAIGGETTPGTLTS